jgi:hypothetical protein
MFPILFIVARSGLITLSLLRFVKLSPFFSPQTFLLASIISPLLEQHHLLERQAPSPSLHRQSAFEFSWSWTRRTC